MATATIKLEHFYCCLTLRWQLFFKIGIAIGQGARDKLGPVHDTSIKRAIKTVFNRSLVNRKIDEIN